MRGHAPNKNLVGCAICLLTYLLLLTYNALKCELTSRSAAERWSSLQ